MNWMIDGLYGDLYRQAMGYPQLQPHDEWEIERNRKALAAPTQQLADRFPALIRSWTGRLASLVGGITTTQHSLERKVS